MNIHVFVVDTTTFKLHLEYMFAGTGAKDKQSPFLITPQVNFHHTTERNLVDMISDISRIREGDKIIFYLQATSKNPGMFFGVFKARSKAFFDENDNNNFLIQELGKGLSYRILIEPDNVYPYGITEHEYLDDLTGKTSPCQLCWSMIYRKLKGNRGCTMITKYEFNDLLNKLELKNNNQKLVGNHFSFDSNDSKIINLNESYEYKGRTNNISIKPRLLYKANRGNAFEAHLQAYIMQNFDNSILKPYLISNDNNDIWIGNEVSCGVGMQRIDTMIIEESNEKIDVKIIELKDEEPYERILSEQLPWYLKWSSQYIIPNLRQFYKPIVVHPFIIAKSTNNLDIINKIRTTNLFPLKDSKAKIDSTQYIGFNITDDEIKFNKII